MLLLVLLAARLLCLFLESKEVSCDNLVSFVCAADLINNALLDAIDSKLDKGCVFHLA